MDKKNKRETHQTGMTDERKRALEQLRSQKNSGKSQLDQYIQVSFLKYNYLIFSKNLGTKEKR